VLNDIQVQRVTEAVKAPVKEHHRQAPPMPHPWIPADAIAHNLTKALTHAMLKLTNPHALLDLGQGPEMALLGRDRGPMAELARQGQGAEHRVGREAVEPKALGEQRGGGVAPDGHGL
jgi:hypothetical protein